MWNRIPYRSTVNGIGCSTTVKKGTGFDYWLGEVDVETKLIQNKAHLEVSGILKAKSTSQIRIRLKQKMQQMKLSDGLEEYAIVVEFSKPTVWMEQK